MCVCVLQYNAFVKDECAPTPSVTGVFPFEVTGLAPVLPCGSATIAESGSLRIFFEEMARIQRLMEDVVPTCCLFKGCPY